MMTTVLRYAGAIAAAIAVAIVLVVVVELFSSIVHPVPADCKGTFEEVCLHVQRCPQWLLAAVVAAWGVTAFVSTWTAGKLGNRGSAVFLGLLLLSAVIFNLSTLPYPAWFKIANLIVIALAIVCGYRFSSQQRALAAANIAN